MILTFVDFIAADLVDLAIKPQKLINQQNSKYTKEKFVSGFNNIQYNPQRRNIQAQKEYHQRHLGVKDVGNRSSNNGSRLSQLISWFRRVLNFRSSSNTERQGEFVAPFALNTLGAGLAVVASLVGVAAAARTPFGRVLSDATPVEQATNGSYLNAN